MGTFAIDQETDPTRQAIVAAMNRLLTGTPQRSSGRLSVSQLAVEAGIKRWQLTHQHTDLKDLFQREVAEDQARRPNAVGQAEAFEKLQKQHAELQAHCRFLEARLHTYATALNRLALENAALSGRDADAGKVRVLPRQTRLP